MSNLRELTLENHKRAERSRFISRFVRKQITPYQYYVYLYNQLMCYYVLEATASQLGLLKDLEAIKRASKISKDLAELESEYQFVAPALLQSTQRYIDYIQSSSASPKRIMAHIYVRHMGDLSGGQMLKKLAPGSGTYYHFDEDVDILKAKIREKLDDSMVAEANHCFDMIYNIFEELENSFHDVESIDTPTARP